MSSRGTPPRDQEFLNKLTALLENGLLIYKIPDPEVRIKGLYQHPLQKVVRNQGNYQRKKFHCWKWLGDLYVVRLPAPNEEALKTPIPSQGAQSESHHTRTDDNGVGSHSGEEGNVRTPGSGGDNRS